uniref:ELM2 domain-containing protein n=1 Tax=Amblyomma aureolatum TaxID=187763 RepID=A0A1E1X1H3_9ACAR
MEKAGKRQWMQSVNGKIRVGPKYQAMIPPFCRSDAAKKKPHFEHTVEAEASSMYCYVSGSSLEENVADVDVKMEHASKGKGKDHSQYLVAEDFLILQ